MTRRTSPASVGALRDATGPDLTRTPVATEHIAGVEPR
ncbi:hypothetical protein HNQ79_005328 [Streptomyces candidus]|uniref:Uncharacterized protein n=1 Tax=Streptomyces candidus TaxID=67283 RepID=A0A7X0HJH6_9ACTN|nr:hypothetical protein [Streptomyces candidus]